MSNQGQDIPKQLFLFSDDSSIVQGRPYKQVRARWHFGHPRDGSMTLCLKPLGNMRKLTTRGLEVGYLATLADCRSCSKEARRMEDVLREELSTWVDASEDWQDGVSNTPSNEGTIT
jgi:hypothetical protein